MSCNRIHRRIDVQKKIFRVMSLLCILLLLSSCEQIENWRSDRIHRELCEIYYPAWNNNLAMIKKFVSESPNRIDKRDEVGEDMTPLHWAAAGDAKEVAEFLLSKGADINAKDSGDGSLPIHTAAKYGSIKVAELLVSKGASVTARTDGGATPLHFANDERIADFLISKGAVVNEREAEMQSPLHYQAFYGNLDVVRLLVKKGADMDAKGINLKTPLHQAADYGKADIVEYLMEKGAELNLQANDGSTALSQAIRRGQKRAALALFSKGGDMNGWKNATGKEDEVRNVIRLGNKDLLVPLLQKHPQSVSRKEEDGTMLLHMAAFLGKTDVAGILISAGAEVDSKDNYGWTPLHFAVLADQKKMAELLLVRGAKINEEGGQGCTPIFWAHSKDMAAMLINKGADLSINPRILPKQMTPLHYMIAEGDGAQVIKHIIVKGADIEASDGNERTPLCLAVQKERKEIVKLLLEKGANPNTSVRLTPLITAVKKNNRKIAKLLLTSGARIDQEDAHGETPLNDACLDLNLEMIRFLIDEGAKANQESSGETALHSVCRASSGDAGYVIIEKPGSVALPIRVHVDAATLEQIVKLLVSSGADINAEATFGETPLHMAAHYYNVDLAAILLSLGADFTKSSYNNKTPLMVARENGYEDIVKLLSSYGATK